LREFETLHSQILIGGFFHSPELSHVLRTKLDDQTYRVHIGEEAESFLKWIGQNRHRVDCLVLELSPDLSETLATLQSRDILLPMVIVELSSQAAGNAVGHEGALDPEDSLAQPDVSAQTACPVSGGCQHIARTYHPETHCVPHQELERIEHHVHQAISQFLNLPHTQAPEGDGASNLEDTRHFLLSLQQQRLSEKLRERLGYLGIYYKRNPEHYIRNLSPQQRSKALEELRLSYQKIVLSYFGEDQKTLNQQIDDFVNAAFFGDISVSKVVEIHMELMDNFSKQLKLEGT
jgi:circadian clock protein KaiA